MNGEHHTQYTPSHTMSDRSQNNSSSSEGDESSRTSSNSGGNAHHELRSLAARNTLPPAPTITRTVRTRSQRFAARRSTVHVSMRPSAAATTAQPPARVGGGVRTSNPARGARFPVSELISELRESFTYFHAIMRDNAHLHRCVRHCHGNNPTLTRNLHRMFTCLAEWRSRVHNADCCRYVWSLRNPVDDTLRNVAYLGNSLEDASDDN